MLFVVLVNAAHASDVSNPFVWKEGDTMSSLRDSDGDGLVDEDEIRLHTNPLEKDTDMDGYFDGEEVHDLGLDPLKKDEQLFSSLGALRLLSIEKDALLHGESVFIKGVYFLPQTQFMLRFENDGGLAFNELLQADKRGVFHKTVNLSVFCQQNKEGVIHMTSSPSFSQSFYLSCPEVPPSSIVSSMTFEGQPVSNQGHYVVKGNIEKGFQALLNEQYQLQGYYSSVVTNAQMISDASTKTIVALPPTPLSPGEHMLTLVVSKKDSKDIYEPIEIPFEIKELLPVGYLKADVLTVTNTSAILIAMVIGMGTIILVRKKRKKRASLLEMDY